MRSFRCQYKPFDDRLRQVPHRDAWRIDFLFELTPVEYVGVPDEERHVEVRTVQLTVGGAAFRGRGIPDDEDKRPRLLWWHAVQELTRGGLASSIDRGYAVENRIDPARITERLADPFEIELVHKMGFHVEA